MMEACNLTIEVEFELKLQLSCVCNSEGKLRQSVFFDGNGGQILSLSQDRIDKQRVHQFAAAVRSCKPPEVYKGKGIMYIDEVIKKKAGKKSK
ncbi:hypothetical protein NL676_023111 [Syzygium grande]|nr:hypothetical protein NL676_023111 [Syzygium grande]